MPLSETSDCTSFSAAEKSDTSWITSSPRSYSRCPCRADGTAGWVSQSRARDECQPQCAVLPGHPAACPACQCGGFPAVGPAGRGLQYFGSEVGGSEHVWGAAAWSHPDVGLPRRYLRASKVTGDLESNNWISLVFGCALFILVYFSFLPSLDFSLPIALPPYSSFLFAVLLTHVLTPLAFLTSFSVISPVICHTVGPPSMWWSNVAKL